MTQDEILKIAREVFTVEGYSDLEKESVLPFANAIQSHSGGEQKPYKVLESTERQPMCTHDDGWICGRCKTIRTPVYLASPDQSARIKTLEALLDERDSKLEDKDADIRKITATNAKLVEQVMEVRENLAKLRDCVSHPKSIALIENSLSIMKAGE